MINENRGKEADMRQTLSDLKTQLDDNDMFAQVARVYGRTFYHDHLSIATAKILPTWSNVKLFS